MVTIYSQVACPFSVNLNQIFSVFAYSHAQKGILMKNGCHNFLSQYA
jgi:hypothetical protein